jgi:hypothetical protein
MEDLEMNTEKYRFEITVTPAPRRVRASGTVPPPIPHRELELFSDDPGRELVDLVDRSHFGLAANHPVPLFQIDKILEDFDDPKQP